MRTTNKVLYAIGAILSLLIWFFCIDAITAIEPSSNKNSIIFMSIIVSFCAAASAACVVLLITQKIFIFKDIFENANDAISIIGKNGAYIWQNKANMLLLGFRDNELKNVDASFFINNTKVSTIEELEKISEFSGIFKVPTKEQNKRVWISAFRVDDELSNTLCYVEMKRNVDEFLKILEQTNKEKEKLEKKANSDFLTGLYNRAGFLSKLEEKYQSLKRISGCIVFVDIDKFKHINDTFGHQMGDQILISVARLISQNLRASDIICRWGGEEFVFWIDANVAITIEICEKIRQKIEDAKPFGILTTCSFGVAKVEGDVEKAIMLADEAMYIAKQNGRNNVRVFENNNQNS